MEHCSIQAARARVNQREGRLASYGNPQAALAGLAQPQAGIRNTTDTEPGLTVTAVKLSPEQYTALCQAVGLDPAKTTVSTMVARILEHLVAAEKEGGNPEELRAQAAEGVQARREANRLREELTEIKAATLIERGISEGKLLGWQRDAWIAMAKANPEETTQALKAMPVKVNLAERGYAGVPNSNTAQGKWF